MSSEKKQKLLLSGLVILVLGGLGLFLMIQNQMPIGLIIGFVVVLLACYWLMARHIVSKKNPIRLAKQDVSASTQQIFEALGGKDNIEKLDHCQTRIKVSVKDSQLVNSERIRQAGLQGVIKPSNTSVQLIAKEMVPVLYEALSQLLNS